jgi:predicted permease
MSILRTDLRYAWRSLAGSPGASLVAILILGAAIGVNVVLLAFIDAYALRALPIAGAERYVDIYAAHERGERTSLWTRDEIAALEAATAPAFDGLYASNFFDLPMLQPRKRMVHGQAVSPRYFPLLGARLAMGRAFGPGEDGVSGEGDVAVLSHVGWKRLLDARADAVGRKIRLGHTWLTVVGVTVPEFRGVEAITPELWIPLTAHEAISGRPGQPAGYDLAGLLREGVTPERASGLGSGVVAGFERPPGPSGNQWQLLVEHRPSVLHAAERSELSLPLLLVLGSFGLVLVVACANLASLHVARAAARHREIATRLALGASRLRLVRQLLTESLLLAAIGAAVGCGFAMVATEWIQGHLFSIVTEAGLDLVPIEIQSRVLAFGLLLGVLAGLAFGLLPAIEATSPDLASGSRRDGLALGGRIRTQRLGGLLVTVQVAASLVLLMLASLLLRNAQAASRLDAGYDVSRLIAFGFPHPTAHTVSRLRQDARVAAASAVGHTPLAGPVPRHAMVVDGITQTLRFNYVDHAYFETLGLDVRVGRTFRADEAVRDARVVVISTATARTLWPGANAVGRTLEVNATGGPAVGRYEVIGVAPDVVSGLLFQGRDASAVYFPTAAGSPWAQEVLVRPRGDTGALLEGLRGLCQEIDSAVLCSPRTLREVAAVQRFPFLAASVAASGLGSLSIALTSIGLYGLVAFAVVQRLREVGVRVALGATPMDVLRLLVGRASRSVLLGLAVGLPACLALSLAAERLFTLLNAFDPVTLLGVPLLLIGVTLVAAFIPARRATLVDPAVSLRVD